MGEEIDTSRFTELDFIEYKNRLQAETELLEEWFQQGRFVADKRMGGYELESWLVDKQYNPSPINEEFLKRLNSEWVTPELSRFNVELNGPPVVLHKHALRTMERDLKETWSACVQTAHEMDADIIMVGILPNIQEDQLVLANMSRMQRYQALNEQVFKLRQGRPLHLDIVGREHLKTTHHDVMFESATTSFQIHLLVSPQDSVSFYNASLIASAALVAVSANSPYLFGHDVWDESRIPLFEQAVEVGGFDGAVFGPTRRVSFGSGYARESLFECFTENLDHFPILLPKLYDDAPEKMSHVRLHNGTIWRWNRPLIGFEEDGTPHMRIEHRVVSAGPTVVDEIANAAFYFGLTQYLATLEMPPEKLISFSQARDNFYEAARVGLSASCHWVNGRKGIISTLIQEELVQAARIGLRAMEIDREDIDYYMGIIEQRVQKGLNGATWQRQYVKKHQCDMRQLTEAYAEHQHTGDPVHRWSV